MIKSISTGVAALALCALSCVTQASEEGNWWFLKGQLFKGDQVVSTFSAPLVAEAPFTLHTQQEVALVQKLEPTTPVDDSAIARLYAAKDTHDRSDIGGFNNAKSETSFYVRTALLQTGGMLTATVGLSATVRETSRTPVDLDLLKPGEQLKLPKSFDLDLNTGLSLWKDRSVELPLGTCTESKQGDLGCYRLVVRLESGSTPDGAQKAGKVR
ncbi:MULTISPECIES: hypothetical protein [Pseudomonas]|uniref:hypothetical protein n=1 Tax=Pseudomonas TaxID=286 RepID=UPI000F042636|nr:MULTISPECIES: hypothetical protein [Pseudomonas]MBD8615526.1 hypothetical protein [Pseudomonas putida]MBD8681822.1 hypothetical protein [Pseudomonas sp. CFBP 13719]